MTWLNWAPSKLITAFPTRVKDPESVVGRAERCKVWWALGNEDVVEGKVSFCEVQCGFCR